MASDDYTWKDTAPETSKITASKSKKNTASIPRRSKQKKVDRSQSWLPKYIDDADARGFFKFKNTKLHTLEESDYERILDNDEQWNSLQSRMGADFNHPLEVFPFEEAPTEKPYYRLNWIERIINNENEHWWRRVKELTDISLPRRYYSIVRSNLEERFPGGRVSGEPGDGDLRDLLKAFRQMFRENLAHYIFKKRQYQFSISAIYILLAISPLFLMNIFVVILSSALKGLGHGGSVVAASLLTVAGLALSSLIMYWGFKKIYLYISENLFDNYKNCQTDSCKTLNTEAALRTKNLRSLITNLAARLGKDSTAGGEAQVRKNEDAEKWPGQAYRWTLLMFWLGRRMESVEQVTQMQMWLIRRTHHFYRLFAVVSNDLLRRSLYVGILLAGAAVLVQLFIYMIEPADIYDKLIRPVWAWLQPHLRELLGLIGLERFAPLDVAQAVITPAAQDATWLQRLWAYLSGDIYRIAKDAILAVYAVVATIFTLIFVKRISRLSAKEWNTPLSLIRENLGVVNWDRFHSANLPYLLAEQVRNDKRMILKREDWVKR